MATGRVPTTANSPLTAKGDLFTYSTAPARLAVGNNGEQIVADSSTSTGLRYQVPVNVNPILNSAFQVWQRGTSVTMDASKYVSDRWQGYRAGGGATTSRQVTGDTTNLPFIQYCARVQRDSGNTSTNGIQIGQSLETLNSIPYAGKTVTFSFYARAGANYSPTSSALSLTLVSGTGTDQNAGTTGFTGSATVISQTATLTTTWQRFSYSGSVAATATQLGFYFNAAPTGTAGANDFYEVTGVQIEVGSVATPFKTYAGTIQGELAACQRYYEKSFPSATAPSNGNAVSFATTATAFTANNARTAWVGFKVNKRTSTPTVTFYRNSDITTNGQWDYYSSGWATPTTTAISSYNDNGFVAELGKTSGFTATTPLITAGEWTAEAEL